LGAAGKVVGSKPDGDNFKVLLKEES